MKFQLLKCSLIILTFINCESQSLSGKWYMPSRSGLSEFIIENDSVYNRKLDYNLNPKYGKIRSQKIYQIIKLDDRVILLTKSKKDWNV